MQAFAVRVQACYHCGRVPLNPAEREVCKCGTRDPLRANPDVPGAKPVYELWGYRIPGLAAMREILQNLPEEGEGG